MYRIYVKNHGDSDYTVLHNPNMADLGYVVVDPMLIETANTHGSLQFQIAPNHPLYSKLEKRNTKIHVISGSKGNKHWFGRVMDISPGFNRMISVYCEGELGCLNDSIYGPFGFKGSPADLFTALITKYNQSNTRGFTFAVGNVSVTDPNNLIVRSSNAPATVWQVMESALFGSSLGGYIIPRYDKSTDTHYIDYLALDENDQYATTATQKIEFGKNLLDFASTSSAADVITVLIPYGAEFEPGDPNYESGPPENGGWNGNRLTIASANNNRIYLESATGIQMWGRIVGSRTWDDVTVAANLKSKGRAWLNNQIWESVSLELSAVDLSFVDTDIEQIQVGEYVRCISKPHDMNMLMLCTAKQTYLTNLERSVIMLGAGQKTITDLQAQSKMKEDPI